MWAVSLSTAIFGPLESAQGQVVRPIPVPGRIQAEDYDTNGTGVSFYDVTPGNNGAVYRNDDVDIEATTDAGGGYDVGWISSGEWLNYTVNIAETAIYQIAFRVASANGTGSINASLDTIPLCGVQTPFTGGWQTWQTVTITNVVLPVGVHTLRLDFSGGFNVNYLQITKQGALTGNFLRASGKS